MLPRLPQTRCDEGADAVYVLPTQVGRRHCDLCYAWLSELRLGELIVAVPQAIRPVCSNVPVPEASAGKHTARYVP